MKRRNFLASLAGLFAMPFVPKAEAEADHHSTFIVRTSPDGSVKTLTPAEEQELVAYAKKRLAKLQSEMAP